MNKNKILVSKLIDGEAKFKAICTNSSQKAYIIDYPFNWIPKL